MKRVVARLALVSSRFVRTRPLRSRSLSRATCYAFGVQITTARMRRAARDRRTLFEENPSCRCEPVSCLHLTAGGLLLGGAIGAQAANLGFLNDTPISYMKQRDVDSIKKAVFAALNDKQDGETTTWVNEGTRQ